MRVGRGQSAESFVPERTRRAGAGAGTCSWVESECQWFADDRFVGGGARVRVSRELSKQVGQQGRGGGQVQGFLSKLASKSKNFFSKWAAKLKFWRRTSESVFTRPGVL